jgi:sugar lactone lactonase YvrE
MAKSGMAAAGVTILIRRQPWEYNNPILGSGAHTYECIHDWLVPPDSIKYGDTQGVAQDSQGRLYVGHTVGAGSQSADAIAVFDPKGKFITSWGARFRGGSHGLDIRREGREEFLYHCDTAHRQVVKTTLSGEVVWEKGLPKEAGTYGEKDPFIPTNVAFAPNGDFYVTDGYGSDWVHQYNIKGDYIRSFGGRGKEPGKLANAHGIWVDTRGKTPELCVCDRGNNRLQYFTLEGSHLRFVTNGMRKPCQADIRRDLMLIPDLDSVVTILDKDNNVVVQLGDGHPSALRGAPRDKWIPGKFIHPHDAMFLRNGDILVGEWVPSGRVTLLKRK